MLARPHPVFGWHCQPQDGRRFLDRQLTLRDKALKALIAFDRGFDLLGGVCHTNHSRNCWEPFFMCFKWCSTSGSALAGVIG